MNNQFEWVEFYKEFAQKLLEYKNDRGALIEKVKAIYDETGIRMPTLELNNELEDIDPFTVFGLFNKSSMREDNRKKILAAIKKLFNVKAAVPDTFDGIPVVNNQTATFYYFKDSRGKNDIDDLWGLFESALAYADDHSDENLKDVTKYFDLVINKKGNANSKVTMGLYWIAPDDYLNLDSRNAWYIYDSGKMPDELIDELPEIEKKIAAKKYFDIVRKLREYLSGPESTFTDFKQLSSEAWEYSNQVNEEENRERELSTREQIGSGLADDDVDTIHYWMYSPGDGACKWDEFYERGVMGLGWASIGDLEDYNSKDEMKLAMKENIDPDRSFKNDAHATWQFCNEIQPGDIVFAKKGMHTLIGRGVVESDYIYDESDPEYPNIRNVKWTDIGEWDHPGQAVMKALTDITQYTNYVQQLCAIFDGGEGEDQESIDYPEYTPEKFLEEVYMDEESYETLVDLVRVKKNVILQGAPGVGKTFVAKRLAYSMMGCKDQSRVMMVQFHQSYTYEDFIEGFRPSSTGNSFEIKKGTFAKFCQAAAEDPDNEYFFIIDEINRGNLSKIFGELFMLIENDKRGNALQLLYSGDKLSVPSNLYLIGMMNTADRSLAMLDYALRRRFAFFEMKPSFRNNRFLNYKSALSSSKFDSLISCVENLNITISQDDTLGEGFCIGHSYFCEITKVTDRVLSSIVEYELIPLLKEYWYDEPIKVRDWTDRLRSSIK